MYESLGSVRLKDGEQVQAGVVLGPDDLWADRVCELLKHKGEIWRWGNAECLRNDLGIDVRFYVLHRDNVPFANMFTITGDGVGHFGHVFTEPANRRKGAAVSLMALQMEDFRTRSGRSGVAGGPCFLGTGYDSAPYHIYHGEGFRGIEAGSGTMEYYPESGAAFREHWFAPGPVEVRAASWENWPTSGPLSVGDFPGTVRCAPLGMFRARFDRGQLAAPDA